MRTTGDAADGGARTTARPSGLRAAGLVAGCLLAVAATAVVFLSDDPEVLRVAVVAVAWAGLGAAFAGGRHPEPDAPGGSDAVTVAAELRRARESELEREAAVHRRAERELQVRGEAEAAMRRELDGLRTELARLRGDLTGLDALRTEVAAIGALRADLAALAGLRADLGELAGLRADVGRLSAGLAERHSGEVHHAGEMHVERVVMRTQSVRTGREPREPATAAAWHADVTRELGGWPAASGAPAAATPTASPATVASATVVPPTVAVPVVSREPEPVARVLTPPPVPVDVGGLRRRSDLPPRPAAERLTVERPSVHAAAVGHGGYAAAVPPAEEAGSARLAEILAEGGVTPGGRRRRYRD
jgi:uncharacterized protein DUF6779